nr:hypothetical protein [uncultured Mediterranean phage uvMED]
MNRPDFSTAYQYAKPRPAKLRGPQAIPPTERIYRCECCNDTGIVQTWKLNKWAFPDQLPLDSTSVPVFCMHFPSCGNLNVQVFTDDKEERRTETLNLFNTPGHESTTIGSAIVRDQALALTNAQSKFIHDSVLAYRSELSRGKGLEYVEQCKAACRSALPATEERGSGGLTRVAAPISMPLPPIPTQTDSF